MSGRTGPGHRRPAVRTMTDNLDARPHQRRHPRLMRRDDETMGWNLSWMVAGRNNRCPGDGGIAAGAGGGGRSRRRS